MTLISVIFPVYNVCKYVEKSLLSVLNQTYDNIEVIVVDDCGDDNSIELVKKILNNKTINRYTFKIIHHEINQGLSSSRNTGMKAATGDYVFFIDSDDEIEANCIEEHLENIEKTHADFTIGKTKLVGSRSIHVKSISPEEINEIQPVESFLKNKWTVSACNKLYNKHFLNKNDIFFKSGLIFEDVLWSLITAFYADKIVYVESAVYRYMIREGSITTGMETISKSRALIRLIDEVVLFLKSVDMLNCESISYINRLKFNTALLLTLSNASKTDKVRVYNDIIKRVPMRGGIGICLFDSFFMFSIVFSFPYFVYKKIQRIL